MAASKSDPRSSAAAPPPEHLPPDEPDPTVDPRFRFTVSVPAVSYRSTARAGWDGALLADGDAGYVRSGEARHEHQTLTIWRWQTPNVARPIGTRGGWTTFPPGVRLFLPGDREFGEWCGHPRAQALFVAPERVEAVLGRPPERTGLARWRDPRYALPFVESVISAMMRDLEVGHPAGPITGDSLVEALLLHLDGVGATRPRPPGRRLDAVRDHIEENLAGALGTADLADLVGVDVRQLAASFAAETGCTPQRYVLYRRIERAKALLRDAELSPAQIARAVGFADEAQLARVVRRHQRAPASRGRPPPAGPRP